MAGDAGAGDDDDPGGQYAPLWKIWSLLRPNLFSSGPDGDGRWEMLGMFVVCIGRAYEISLQTEIVRMMDGVLNSRDIAVFKRGLVQTVGCAIAGAAFRLTYSYLQARLTWKWRNKLTRICHEKYFRDMNYYFIGEGGGTGGDKMEDADNRIAEDVKLTAAGFSTCFSDIVYALFAGVFYTYKLWRLYNPVYALMPYLYFCFSFSIVDILSPNNWRKLMGDIQTKFARYREAHTRLMIHSEAVAALKGSEVEAEIITKRYELMDDAVLTLHKSFFHFGTIQNWVNVHWRGSFTALLVIGPGIWRPLYDKIDTIQKMSETRGDVGAQFMLVTNSLDSCNKIVEMIRTLQQLVGNAGRVTGLLELLERLSQRKDGETSKNIGYGDRIAFDGVDIITPKGVKLVTDLTFNLERGGSLLLTGHNGAGKSSIFRCLGDQVLGTLRDQMTYPAKGGDQLSMDRLRDILRQVDLTYLLDRDGVLEDEINWEEVLSLGEKQRLAMARLIFAKPNYAILDECTSAVSSDMERRLYAICLEHDVTYVTISHRPALQAYHRQMLAIGDGKQGFSLTDIDSDAEAERALAMARASVVDKDTEMSIRRHTDARSQHYEPLPKAAFEETSTLSQLRRIWQLSAPKNWALQASAVVGIIVAELLVSDLGLKNTSKMFRSLMTADKQAMIRQVLTSLCFATCRSVIWESMLWYQRRLGVAIGRRLTYNYLQRYVKHNLFYRLIHLDARVKDADQRLCDDIREFSQKLTNMLIELIRPAAHVAFYTARIGSFMGYKAPLAMLAYYIISLRLLRALMPDYKNLVRMDQELDGKFKYVHSRVKMHAESIAFFGGDDREHTVVQTRFKALMDLDWQRQLADFQYRVYQNVFQAQIPNIIQWLNRFFFAVWYGGTDAEMLEDSGASVNEAQLYLWANNNAIFTAMGQLVDCAEKFASLSGNVVRVAEMDAILTALEVKGATNTATASDVDSGGEQLISFEDVDLVTPSGVAIAANIDCTVTADTPLMVTGANATGKTSFFRVMGGLWPLHKGKVTRPAGKGSDGLPGIEDIFLVPQRIYMVLGTLADQVTYPHRIPKGERTQEQEAQLQELLDLVGIGYLVERWQAEMPEGESGWDFETKWEDVLSLGEQQRTGMARLYYHSPKFGILDECTSAVSVDVEEKLYTAANERGIACITISQRLALTQFHTQELRLGCNNADGWERHKVEFDASIVR